MKHVDDRTEEQKRTHTIIVAMTDTFMSGWGGAKDGTSYAGWACLDKDRGDVEAWVRSRSDAKHVRVVGTDWRPKGRGHTHIYVVTRGHPALSN